MTGFKSITVKFSADCRDCGGHVAVGETALWKKGFGVVHEDASVCGRTVYDPHGREVGVAGSTTSYERATYDDGRAAARDANTNSDFDADGVWTCDRLPEYVECYDASRDFRCGWLDEMRESGGVCPDGCCGAVAPGVIC